MLRQVLLVAPKPDEKCGVVYNVKCDTCDEEYVGETGRQLSMNMKEDKSSVLYKDLKSAMGEHILKRPVTILIWQCLEYRQ